MGVKVASIELGEALSDQQALLEVVAVIFLETIAVGGLVFFCCLKKTAEKSGAAWLMGIESDVI